MTFREKLSIIIEASGLCVSQDDEVVNEIFYADYKGRVNEVEERESAKTRIGFLCMYPWGLYGVPFFC